MTVRRNHHLTVGQAVRREDGRTGGVVVRCLPDDWYVVRWPGAARPERELGATLEAVRRNPRGSVNGVPYYTTAGVYTLLTEPPQVFTGVGAKKRMEQAAEAHGTRRAANPGLMARVVEGAKRHQRRQLALAEKLSEYVPDARLKAVVAAGKRLVGDGRKKNPMTVQSLLFAKGAWTDKSAAAWARRHGYKGAKVDPGSAPAGYLRVRQADPKGFKVLRTITFGHGIKAVVGRKK